MRRISLLFLCVLAVVAFDSASAIVILNSNFIKAMTTDSVGEHAIMPCHLNSSIKRFKFLR